MKINVDVRLVAGDTFAYDAAQAANQVIAALGGNPANDYCTVDITQPVETGTAGAPAE